MKTETILSAFLFVLLIILGIFLGLKIGNGEIFSSEPSSPKMAHIPTADIAAVAEWTPTTGPAGGNQMAIAEAKAYPTPYTKWTKPDFEAFKEAMYPKITSSLMDLNIYTKVEGPGFGYFCSPFYLWEGVDVELGRVAYISTVWAEWYAGITEKDWQQASITITEGEDKTFFYEEENPYIDYRKMANVVITIPQWGLIGPVIRDENQSAHEMADLGAGIRVLLMGRELLWGESTPREMREATINHALSMAKWDSLLLFGQNGGEVSMDNVNLLRENLEYSLNSSTFGFDENDGIGILDYKSPYNRLFDYANSAALEAGFGGVDNLQIVIEGSGLFYLETLDSEEPVPLVPEDLATRYQDSACKFAPNESELLTLFNIMLDN